MFVRPRRVCSGLLLAQENPIDPLHQRGQAVSGLHHA